MARPRNNCRTEVEANILSAMAVAHIQDYTQLAAKAGISTATLQRVCSGAVQPTLETMFKLAQVMGVTVESLIDTTGKKMLTLQVIVHEIAVDGLPETDEDGSLKPHLLGRVAFISDGDIFTGFPTKRGMWYDNYGKAFDCVTHWLEFPITTWSLEAEG